MCEQWDGRGVCSWDETGDAAAHDARRHDDARSEISAAAMGGAARVWAADGRHAANGIRPADGRIQPADAAAAAAGHAIPTADAGAVRRAVASILCAAGCPAAAANR